MDDPNITMEEYIRLEEEKARRHAIVFDDTSDAALSCEPTVSPLDNNEIDFKISFDDSNDEDYMVIFDENSFSYKIIYVDNLKTDSENENDKVNMPSSLSQEPTIDYIDDLDFFKDFENEFPTIAYNDLKSKSDPLIKPSVNMAPLPHRDLRHPWLRYQVEGYTEDIVRNFEHRLETIFSREASFTSHAWRRLFEVRGPLVREFMLEFFSTCRMSDTKMGLDRIRAEKVTGVDLFYLRTMDHGTTNVPYLLAQYLLRHAEGRKSGARLSRGHFIGYLTAHFGPPVPGDQEAAGAPGSAEDAPRIERLEEEMCELWQSVMGLRGVIESSITEQTRVSTWMISCMAQLMDSSDRTYQAFDSTLVGSSRVPYQRHVRPRTGDASTSIAPHIDDQPDP
ncbi:hypothetical protein Tco_0397102 [Tanacetum coccineum]